jgi:hypothetical protein
MQLYTQLSQLKTSDNVNIEAGGLAMKSQNMSEKCGRDARAPRPAAKVELYIRDIYENTYKYYIINTL